MYDVTGVRSLAIRKSPSMPMLEISMGGGDLSYMESAMGKCPSGRKTSYNRKVKSAISLCAGILLCTVVLFVLVALDPSKVAEEPWRINSRGPSMLVTLPNYRNWTNRALVAETIEGKESRSSDQREEEVHEEALEGMGMLFRRGTHGMPQLVVAHLSESTNPEDLRLFLRGLHRSGMPSRADVVLLFPFRPLAANFTAVIREEEQYFQRLLAKVHRKESHAAARKPMTMADRRIYSPKLSVFNSAAYTRTPSASEFGKGPSVWAKHRNDTKGNNSETSPQEDAALHYGAVVGFDVQELDPDDALSGFLDSPSIYLRRWICYQILLGMVRHRFRHVFLTEVTGVFILKDVLAPLKKKDTNLHLYYTGHKWSDIDTDSDSSSAPSSESNATNVMQSVYGKAFWNSLDEEDKNLKVISTGVVLGGIRPVRSVATAMATEIVRVALLRKSREPFRVEALLSNLVHKSSVLGRKVASHLQVHESAMSTVNLLPGLPRERSFNDFFRRSDSRFAVIQGLRNRGTSEARRKKILEALRKDICRSQNDLEIYTDCYALPEAVIEMMIQ